MKYAEIDTTKLTIRLHIENKEEMGPIWEAFKKGLNFFGTKIMASGWGDYFKERDAYKEVAEAAMKEENIGFYPEYDPIELDGKIFHQCPFGVWSTNEDRPLEGEWYPSEDALKKAYNTK